MKGLMQNIYFIPSSIPAETMYGIMNLFKREDNQLAEHPYYLAMSSKLSGSAFPFQLHKACTSVI